MKTVLLFLLGACLTTALDLNENEEKCLAEVTNQETLNNDFLLGIWYDQVKFTFFGAVVPSPSCKENNITRPSADELQKYKDFYGTDLPISFDDNPVSISSWHGYYTGLIFGSKQAKLYATSPSSGFYNQYNAHIYKIINENYIFFWTCENPTTRWIWSRVQYPRAEELEMLMTLPEVSDLNPQRFCMPY